MFDIVTLSPQIGQYDLSLNSSLTAIIPQFSQTGTTVLSESNLSFKSRDAPWATKQSFSISPNLRPPSLALPSVGCLVSSCIGPLALECILFATMCLSLRWYMSP